MGRYASGSSSRRRTWGDHHLPPGFKERFSRNLTYEQLMNEAENKKEQKRSRISIRAFSFLVLLVLAGRELGFH